MQTLLSWDGKKIYMADEAIDRYQIREEIGAGGMGTVYRAWDSEIQRDVALKWLPTYFSADATFTERFKREARVVARLEHPHIVPIYDVGESEGRPFIIMRLLSGGTLRDQTGKPGFDLAALVKALDEIGDALTAAHARHIVHRDIKPGNILFDENGSAFLSDFGIAKVLDSATQLTGSGFIGTPAYMSPEQFIGQGIDGRSDQYSLAVVVYESLTGDLPFRGNTAQMMYKHINTAPPEIDLASHAIPEAINPVLQKALAKNPDDRYPRIQDFVTAMKVALRENPAAAAIPLPLAAAALRATPSTPATAPTAIDTPSEQQTEQLQTTYSAGVEAMLREDWVAAIAAFDTVLRTSPNYGNAAEFKREAEAKLTATEAENEASSAAAFAAGAAVAAGLAHEARPQEKPSVAETEVEFGEATFAATQLDKTSVDVTRDTAPGAVAGAAAAAAATGSETSLDLPPAAAAGLAAASAAPAESKEQRKGIPLWAVIAGVILLLLLCGGAVAAGINFMGGRGDDGGNVAAGQESGNLDGGDVAVAAGEGDGRSTTGVNAVAADQLQMGATATEEPQPTDTQPPQPTGEPVEEATAVPAAVEPTEGPPTEIPPTATGEPSETPEPVSPMVRVIVSSANTRSGPGTIYRTLRPVLRDDLATVIAKNSDSSWFNIELEDGSRAWIAASVVEMVEGAAANEVSVAATIPVAPTRTPVPPTWTPIPPPPTQPPADSGGGGNSGGSSGGGGGNNGGSGGGGAYTREAPH